MPSSPVAVSVSARQERSASGAPSRANSQGWENLFSESIYQSSPGAPVRFALLGGEVANGTLRYAERKDGRVIYVAGVLTSPEKGRFFFQEQTLPGKAGAYAGVVEFPDSKTGYRLEPTGPGGSSELVKIPLDKVVCMALPAGPEAVAGKPSPALGIPRAEESLAAEPIPPLDPTDFPDYPIPDYQDGIIPLQSLPGVTPVLYIDYRGGYTPTWGGIEYERPNVSNAQIRDVWKRVAEDFAPFNINVTTDIKIYQSAPENSRQRCVVTPTTTAAPGAGGVAYMNSWNWTGDTPCWVFMVSGKSCAEAVSHEIGHTLQLGHDGQNPSTGYYGGQGSGEVGWAPIMGVGYYKPVSQWSKGEYTDANNTEDDLVKIVGNNNNVDYRVDDTGPVLATSRYLEIYTNFAFAEGLIETAADTDGFQFTTTGGAVSLRANPVGDWGNLAMSVTLCNASDTVILSNNPQTTLWASLSTTVPAGTYTFRVTGAGRNDPATNGFSAYGSLGYYYVTGTVANARQPTRFSIPESSPNGTIVGTIPANNPNGSALVYTVISGNTSSAFALNNSGVLTVASSSVLNYETLGKNTTQLPVQFQLLVNITNVANPTLTELNRRVVVAIEDINERPTATGFNVTVLEHTQPGTLLGKISGSDPDFYNLLSYRILSGDTNEMFSLGTQTGELRVAGDLNRAIQSVYQLQVRVSDQAGPPPLMSTVTVLVTVAPQLNGFVPGGINYAVYTNLTGSTLPDLTNAYTFPRDPASEKLMATFEGDYNRGDYYGSALRGYLIPPFSGSYAFWIASDDSSELYISTSTNPASMTRIAYVSGYTSPRSWNSSSTQKSAPRTLVAGQAYYIEARQKDNTGDDHVEVAWAGPGITGTNIIPGLYLAPFPMNYQPHATGFTRNVRRDTWRGARLGQIAVRDANTNDTHSFIVLSGNSEGIFQVDGEGWVQVADDAALRATATGSFALSVRVTDNGQPPLTDTTWVTLNLVESNAVLVTTLQREMFYNIGNGTAVSDLTNNAKFPRKIDALVPLSDFASLVDVADNYGSRVRGYVVPPVSGDYRFFIASDDASQLKFSPSANPTNAVRIASVSNWTGTNEWTKEAGQTSALQTGLVAGQQYYIEALQKEGGGGDHLFVAWSGPGVSGTNVISAAYLQPADLNYPPDFKNQALAVVNTAANGTMVGTLVASDSPLDSLTFALLGGNTNGTFTLDPATGVLTVSDNALIADGTVSVFTLTVAVQDTGLGGLYPCRSAQGTVTVTVLGTNTPLVWTGGAPGNNWADAGNWRGAAPVPGARLIFGFPAQQSNLNDSLDSLGWVQLTNGGFTLSGAAVTVQSGITNSGNNTWHIRTTLGAPQTWYNASGTFTLDAPLDNGGNLFAVAANADVKVNGSISGTGGLNKSGSSRLLISGTHSYTGPTIVAAASGTTSALEVNGVDDLDLGSSDLTLNGRMDLWNHNVTVGALNGAGVIFGNSLTHALTVGANNHSGSFAGLLTNYSWSSSAVLALIKIGTGAQGLSGANTFSGGTTISAGQLTLLNASALGRGAVTLGDAATGTNSALLLASSALTVNNNMTVAPFGTGPAVLGTVNFNPGSVNMQYGGALVLNRDAILQAGSTDRTTFAGQITGTGGLTVSSPFAAGRRVVFDRTSGLSNDFSGPVLVSTNAVLQLGVATSVGNRTIPDGTAVQLAPAAQLRLAPTGSGDYEIIGALSNAAGVPPSAGAGSVDMVSGTSFSLILGGGNASGYFSGSISNSVGSLTLSKLGAGRQVLAGPNYFSGPVLISGGTLVAAHGAALGTLGGTSVSPGGCLGLSNNITIAGEALNLSGSGPAGAGSLLNESGNNVFTGPVTLTGPATVGVPTGTLSLLGAWNLAANTVTLEPATAANIVVSGNINGSGGVVKRGAGSLRLNNANAFTGDATVQAGTLLLGPSGGIASAGAIDLESSAMLDVSALAGWTLGSAQTLQGEGSVTGDVIAGGTVAPGHGVGTLTINGQCTLAGHTVIEVYKSGLSRTNDVIACTGSLIPGGDLVITNVGADVPIPGDSFRILNVSGFGPGAFASVDLPPLPAGRWDTSTLLTDGTIRVLAEPSQPPVLDVAEKAGTLRLSWPAAYSSYVLHGQTNPVGLGLGSFWTPVPGVSNNSIVIPVDPENGSTFYRLIQTNP